jgi:two-component system, OmpR family, sensor kinase
MNGPGWRRSLATRLTVVATGASAIALVALLAALYVIVIHQVDAAVVAGLRARAADLEATISMDGAAALAAEPFAQLYDGGAVQSSPSLRDGQRLVPEQRQVPAGGQLVLTQDVNLPGRSETLQVLAQTLPDGRVLAVGTSLELRDSAADRLLVGLGVAGPLLLLLVAATVNRVARAALQPVADLTREAASITAGEDAGRRLTVVPGDDEIAQLATTLDAMLRRLAVAFENERAFVDDASHELRTPVAVIRGELELALSDLADGPGVEESLRAALAEAERLSKLSEDLLVLARERAGTLELRREVVDVRGLLHATVRRLHRATGLELSVDCPALQVRGDEPRLEQVLANLVVNAAAAGARTAVLRAAAKPGDHNSHWALSVEDDGPGFPAGFAEAAFGRFSRADPARTRTAGAGLGLSLVAAIVHAAGGSVTAGNDSALGGAAVRIQLPQNLDG